MSGPLHESVIRDFLIGAIAAEELEAAVGSSAYDSASNVISFEVQELNDCFLVNASHLCSLAKATAGGALTAETLSAVAFLIIASEQLYWEDNVVGEVLYDWSSPEINLPLTSPNLDESIAWLTGTKPYVSRASPAAVIKQGPPIQQFQRSISRANRGSNLALNPDRLQAALAGSLQPSASGGRLASR
jgi:hypothetical protein